MVLDTCCKQLHPKDPQIQHSSFSPPRHEVLPAHRPRRALTLWIFRPVKRGEQNSERRMWICFSETPHGLHFLDSDRWRNPDSARLRGATMCNASDSWRQRRNCLQQCFSSTVEARPAQQTDSGIQIASNSASNPISVIPVPFWAQRPMVFL